LRRRTKKTTSATRATNSSDPPTTPAISRVLSVGVEVEATMFVVEDERSEVIGVEDDCALGVSAVPSDVGVEATMLVVEDERPVVVGVEDDCAIVDAVVAPIAIVVAVIGELAAAQVATGRLEQGHKPMDEEGLVVQSCGFR
jgi:hypothetical protein